MSTAIRTAVISTLALFALLIAPSARADGFDITGHTNTEACNSFGGPSSCANVSFALVAETEPFPGPPYHDTGLYLITSLTGEINGQSITAPSPDGILNTGPRPPTAIPFAPGIPEYLLRPGDVTVRFMLGSQPGFFGLDDEFTGSIFMDVGQSFTYVTWDTTPIIATLEPSSLLLSGVGIIALGALGTAKRFL